MAIATVVGATDAGVDGFDGIVRLDLLPARQVWVIFGNVGGSLWAGSGFWLVGRCGLGCWWC